MRSSRDGNGDTNKDTIEYRKYVTEDFKKTFHNHVVALIKASSVVNPMTEADEKIIKSAINMLRGFDNELQECTSLQQMNDLVNVDMVVEHWDDISTMIQESGDAESVVEIFNNTMAMPKSHNGKIPTSRK